MYGSNKVWNRNDEFGIKNKDKGSRTVGEREERQKDNKK